MARETNKYIGIVILVCGIVLIIIFGGLAFFAPDKYIEYINNIRAKTLLLFFIISIICLFGLITFKFFHYPKPRRLILTSMNLVVFFGVIFTGLPLALFKIDSVTLTEAEVSLSFGDATMSSSFTLMASFLILYLLNKEYINVAKYEHTHGVLT